MGDFNLVMDLYLVLKLLEEEKVKFNIKREINNEYKEIPLYDDDDDDINKSGFEKTMGQISENSKIDEDRNIDNTKNRILESKRFAYQPKNVNSLMSLKGENSKTFSCEICSKVYGSSDTLSHHRSFHKGDTKCEDW